MDVVTNKRQLTADFDVLLSGDFLPPQLKITNLESSITNYIFSYHTASYVASCYVASCVANLARDS